MDIDKYIYSECFSPVQIRIYNGIKNAYEYKNVPCGKCYHCKITRINEWVTRMVAQSNYSKYVYYGTLTYSGRKPTIYTAECLAVNSSFNESKTLNLTPLVLRKDHAQKFFKRLRKNTGVKFQYAVCGEYGEKYSRPHMHYIIWSNNPISYIDICRAWSAPYLDNPDKKGIIGRIEHRDIKNNAYPAANDPDNTAVFKYVCKYIQKFDFDFDKLKNIKLHYKYFSHFFDYISYREKNLFPLYDEYRDLNFNDEKPEYEKLILTKPTLKEYEKDIYYLSDEIDDYLKSKGIKDFDDYKKVFSPFFHCSKKPAIGFQYLQDNLGRFQSGDFELHGLPSNYIFPLYYVRKTKESLCPIKAKSETNESPTTYSRVPKMATLLESIEFANQIGEDTDQIVKLFWSKNNNTGYQLKSAYRIQELVDNTGYQHTKANNSENDGYYLYDLTTDYLSFFNIETRIYYKFNGTNYALYNTRDKKLVGYETIENVKQLINYYYERLKYALLISLNAKSAVSADKKDTLIQQLINDGEIKDKYEFPSYKDKCKENLIAKINRDQEIYKKSKKFE